jgi:hypothetical protein
MLSGARYLGARLSCLLTGDGGGYYLFHRLLPHRVAVVRRGHTQARSDRLRAILEKLPPGFYAGICRPPVISRSMPLAEAQLAYQLVAKGEHGRVVLKPR